MLRIVTTSFCISPLTHFPIFKCGVMREGDKRIMKFSKLIQKLFHYSLRKYIREG